MRSIRAAVGWGLAIAVVLGCLGLWLWGKPRAEVTVPPPSTSPAEFIRTYAHALNERDFKAAHTMYPTGPEDHWWELHTPHITDLEIVRVSPVTPGAHCRSQVATAWKQCVQVDTTATFQNWKGMDDADKPTKMGWTYYLVRTSNATQWRIIDWAKS